MVGAGGRGGLFGGAGGGEMGNGKGGVANIEDMHVKTFDFAVPVAKRRLTHAQRKPNPTPTQTPPPNDDDVVDSPATGADMPYLPATAKPAIEGVAAAGREGW